MSEAPDNTGEKRKPSPPVEHQFKPGNPGRPPGSRNKLGEDFVAALQADFKAHGIAAIATVRQERPQDYLKVIASIMPKQIEIKETPFDGLDDDTLAALVMAARGALGVRDEGDDRVSH